MSNEINMVDRDKVIMCPHCGAITRTYYRHFNSNMALAAIVLYHLEPDKFYHLENTMAEHGYHRSGDASYLTHYGIFEKLKGKRADGSPKNGMYRLTAFGRMFVEGKVFAKEIFVMSKGKILEFTGKPIGIREALGEKFDFYKLMNQSQ